MGLYYAIAYLRKEGYKHTSAVISEFSEYRFPLKGMRATWRNG